MKLIIDFAETLEEQNADTIGKLIRMQSLASELNMQLVQASGDVEKLRQERDEILDKLAAQEKLLRDILSVSFFNMLWLIFLRKLNLLKKKIKSSRFFFKLHKTLTLTQI